MSKLREAALWALIPAILAIAAMHAYSGAPQPVRQVSYVAG
jgi:hypothetical protein